jgi:hypothetical protein
VKSLGQSAADAGTAAGDEDGVAGELHDLAPLMDSILSGRRGA